MPFARGAKNELVLALDVAEEAFDPLPVRDTAAHGEIGFGIGGAPPPLGEVGHDDEKAAASASPGSEMTLASYSSASSCPAACRAERLWLQNEPLP